MRMLLFIAFIVIAQSVCLSADAKSIFDKAEVKHERWKLTQNLKSLANYDVECVMGQRTSGAFCLVHEPEHPELCPSRLIGNFDEDGDWSECEPEMRNGEKYCAEHDLTTCLMLVTWTPPLETLASNTGSSSRSSTGENPIAKIFGLMTGKPIGKSMGSNSNSSNPNLSLPCKVHTQNCGVITEGSLPGVGKTLVEVGEVETRAMFNKARHTSYAYVELPNS